MLMVAYETVAYGSLLRIVAYEMFHVPASEHNEKCKMKMKALAENFVHKHTP